MELRVEADPPRPRARRQRGRPTLTFIFQPLAAPGATDTREFDDRGQKVELALAHCVHHADPSPTRPPVPCRGSPVLPVAARSQVAVKLPCVPHGRALSGSGGPLDGAAFAPQCARAEQRATQQSPNVRGAGPPTRSPHMCEAPVNACRCAGRRRQARGGQRSADRALQCRRHASCRATSRPMAPGAPTAVPRAAPTPAAAPWPSSQHTSRVTPRPTRCVSVCECGGWGCSEKGGSRDGRGQP